MWSLEHAEKYSIKAKSVGQGQPAWPVQYDLGLYYLLMCLAPFFKEWLIYICVNATHIHVHALYVIVYALHVHA